MMKERKENMARLQEAGYSYGKIGLLYGISRQRVHQLISGYEKNRRRIQAENGHYWKIYNMVLTRDNHLCQKCQATEDLIIHHLDGNDNNNVIANLITLCNSCHLNLHRPTTEYYNTPARQERSVLIKHLRKLGMSYRQIGREVGLSYTQIMNILRR